MQWNAFLLRLLLLLLFHKLPLLWCGEPLNLRPAAAAAAPQASPWLCASLIGRVGFHFFHIKESQTRDFPRLVNLKHCAENTSSSTATPGNAGVGEGGSLCDQTARLLLALRWPVHTFTRAPEKRNGMSRPP